MVAEAARQSDRRLVGVLAEHPDDLLRRWTHRVLHDPEVPFAARLSEPELRNEVPTLLADLGRRLAAHAGALADERWAGADSARAHARQRARKGYGTTEALRELAHLRAAILDLCADEQIDLSDGATRILHQSIDDIMGIGVAEMEGLVQESARRLHALLTESHEAVVMWRPGGGIVSWNRGAEEAYGWTAAEAMGEDPHRLLRTELPSGVGEIDRVLAGGGRWEGALVHTARDGRRVVVESRFVVQPGQDGPLVLQLDRDVTARLQAEEATRASEARLRAIIDAAVDAIIVIDERGTVERVNPATERLFGYPSAELVGQNITLLMPERYACEHPGYLDHYLTTGEARIIGSGREVTGRRKDGAHFPLELAVSEVRLDHHRLFTGILRDISARKRAEQEHAELLCSERAARSDAEHAAHLRDEFVATLSHELRSPLNAILGWTGLLRAGKLDGAGQVKALEVVERNARSLAELVEDLLDISRIGSGKLRLEPRPVDLGAILDNVVASYLPAATAKGVRLEKSLGAGACAMQGDPCRLEQIFSNLVSNAVKFTPAGGEVRLDCACGGEIAEVSIRDTGKGIDPSFLPHVFDRFRQAEASLTRHHRGLGLGLSLVKFLVEQHGGEVRAESEGEGRGATFTVTLPVTMAGACAAPPLPPIDRLLAGLRVLIVDDEEDARALLRRLLEDGEAEVTVASSAGEALDALPRLLPDALVSDIGMPEVDGYALIRSIRSLPPERGGATPAVALTAFTRPEERQRALAAGFQVHLAKPLERRELLLAIASLTGRVAATRCCG